METTREDKHACESETWQPDEGFDTIEREFGGHSTPVSVDEVVSRSMQVLEYADEVVGEGAPALPCLSPESVRDFYLVRAFLRTSNQCNLIKQFCPEAYTHLAKKEQKIGKKVARYLVDMAADYLQASPCEEKVSTLIRAVGCFESWLEIVTKKTFGDKLTKRLARTQESFIVKYFGLD